jgi:hypothetical protein
MASNKSLFSSSLELSRWFDGVGSNSWFDKDTVFPYASSVSDSAFNTASTTTYVAISDVLKVQASASGSITLSAPLSFQPQALINGEYNTGLIWRYRVNGGSWVDVGSAVLSSVLGGPAIVIAGVLDSSGNIEASGTLASLDSLGNYELQLYAARESASPANTIDFTGTATASTTATPTYILSVATVAYTETLNSVVLVYNRTIAVATVSFTSTLQTVGIVYNRAIAVDTTSYTQTLNSVGLVYGRAISVATVSYAEALNDVALTYSRVLPVATASYTATLNSVGLVYGRTLAVASLSYAMTLNNVGLVYTPVGAYTLTVATAAYVETLNTIALVYNRVLPVATMAYTETLNAVTLTYTPVGGYTYTLPVVTVAYVKTHNNIGLIYSGASSSLIVIGTQPVTTMYIGTTPVTKVYIGTAQVF